MAYPTMRDARLVLHCEPAMKGEWLRSGCKLPLKKFLPVVTFLAVAIISLAMAAYAYVATEQVARIKFGGDANDAQDRIVSRVELQLSLLRATKALFQSHDGKVTPSSFQTFYKSLDVKVNFAGLHGMGFLQMVAHGDEAAIESELTADFGDERKVHPPSNQPLHAVIALVEPHDAYSDPVIGFDMMVDPTRRAAIEQAMGDDKEHATGQLMLGENTGASRTFPGFLVFQRVPGKQAGGAGAGLVFSSFRAQDLFQAAMARAPLLPVNLEVYDGPVDGGNLMFRSQDPPAASLGEQLATAREVKMANRKWTVVYRPTSAFEPPASLATPVMIAVLGLLLATALASLARYQQQALLAGSTLHSAMEKSLLEKDLMLQEMKHRIKNSIARVLAIARQTAAQASDVDEFSSSFSARLQAMAVSQDMLTRSRWQKADLGDLLQIELSQVLGKDLPDDLLEGPEVLLDEAATQALGLTFHELATNALKYGKVGSLTDTLKIRWRVEGPARKRMLALDWTETGQTDLDAPEATGFGTKLINLNITRELGGEIARDYHSDGLKVRIRVPLSA